MAQLNYKHLRYFWMVGKAGSIARAGEQLHLTPQSISGQLRELEASLGVELLRKAGRGLELTETGRRVFACADEIFALGDEAIPNASAVLLRREIFEKLGGFDVGLSIDADYMMWAKMLVAADMAFVVEPLNSWRWHDGSVTWNGWSFGYQVSAPVPRAAVLSMLAASLPTFGSVSGDPKSAQVPWHKLLRASRLS